MWSLFRIRQSPGRFHAIPKASSRSVSSRHSDHYWVRLFVVLNFDSWRVPQNQYRLWENHRSQRPLSHIIWHRWWLWVRYPIQLAFAQAHPSFPSITLAQLEHFLLPTFLPIIKKIFKIFLKQWWKEKANKSWRTELVHPFLIALKIILTYARLHLLSSLW